MKNTEIIKVAALVTLTAALLYRKYKNKKKSGASTAVKPDKPVFSSGAGDDDYEPYSRK